jgi:hypothetical protein
MTIIVCRIVLRIGKFIASMIDMWVAMINVFMIILRVVTKNNYFYFINSY